jgi:hypothetical protein
MYYSAKPLASVILSDRAGSTVSRDGNNRGATSHPPLVGPGQVAGDDEVN